jgi:hypothetical protein
MSSLLEMQHRPAALEFIGASVLTPSSGAGVESETIERKLSELRSYLETPAYSPTVTRSMGAPGKDLEQQLFDKRATLKMIAAAVAMHLTREWRDSLFRQLDSLLDVQSWDRDDQLADDGSFYSFLRMIIFLNPERRPGLGLAYNGNLVAAWTTERNRLTIECLPRDQLRWVLARLIDDDFERAAGVNLIYRLPEVLAPYSPEVWFSHAKENSTAPAV